jgi:hypothetical protein
MRAAAELLHTPVEEAVPARTDKALSQLKIYVAAGKRPAAIVFAQL